MLPSPLKPPILKVLLFKTVEIVKSTGARIRGYNPSFITVSVLLFLRLPRWFIFAQMISCRDQPGHVTPHPKGEALLCACVWRGPHNKLTDLFTLKALPFGLQSTPSAMLKLVHQGQTHLPKGKHVYSKGGVMRESNTFFSVY